MDKNILDQYPLSGMEQIVDRSYEKDIIACLVHHGNAMQLQAQNTETHVTVHAGENALERC